MNQNLKIGLLSYGEWMKNEENALIMKELEKRGHTVFHLNTEELVIRYAYEGTKAKISTPNLEDFTTLDILIIRGVFKHMKLAINVAEFAKSHGVKVIDNGLSEEKYLVNKVADGLKLLKNGLPYPKSAHSLSLEEYKKLLDEFNFPLVIKHRSMGKGSNIFKLKDRVDAENLLEELDKEGKLKLFYMQEFLTLKADYRVFVLNGQVIGSMQRFPPKGDFRANFSLGGKVKYVDTTDEMQDLATKGAQATNALLYAGVDVVYTEDNKPYLLEVNRTPGFTGLMKATKVNVPKLIVDYVLNE